MYFWFIVLIKDIFIYAVTNKDYILFVEQHVTIYGIFSSLYNTTLAACFVPNKVIWLIQEMCVYTQLSIFV